MYPTQEQRHCIFQTLFNTGNCSKPFNIFTSGRRFFFATWITSDWQNRPYVRSWFGCTGRKTYSREKTLFLYVGSLHVNIFFIYMDIMNKLVESVALRLSGSAGPGGMDSEVLKGWLLKFGYRSKKLRISVKSFMECPDNQHPPRSTYQTFMSCHLIILDKLPGVYPVGFGETCLEVFAK